jgi:beta-phosphoglucomutase-like phosphatase (HAD superfamily)
MKLKIKAILWDADGVLIRMCNKHREVLDKALEKICDYKLTDEEHQKYYNGISTTRKLDILELRGIVEKKQKHNIWLLKQQYTTEVVKSFPKDFIKIEMCKKLKADGYKICCVSNSINITTENMMKSIGILEYLDFYLGNECFGKNIKPHPYPYLLAFEKLQLKPDECLICEDSEKGLLSAYASGAHVMEIKDVDDVNYKNIKNKIKEIEDKS